MCSGPCWLVKWKSQRRTTVMDGAMRTRHVVIGHREAPPMRRERKSNSVSNRRSHSPFVKPEHSHRSIGPYGPVPVRR